MTPDQALTDAFRDDWGRVVANLIALTGDWDLAEDSAQHAFAQALPAWRRDGVPRNPQAWLTTAARNRAIDVIRRDRVAAAKLAQLVPEPSEVDGSGIEDERLRLIFTCCHPAIALESQVALALRTLCGLSVAEIARAFLVGEAAMAKRLVRAKQKITVARIPYRVPSADQLPARIPGVRPVLYLLFNEGYAATAGPDLLRPDLCEQAIELTRMVCDLMPDPESWGLLALMQLTHARSAARVGPGGELMPLEEQDRTQWSAAGIAAGLSSLENALRRERIGPYQVQALIAATHATAPSPEQTDWDRIVRLYDELIAATPTPTVLLNRAVAVGMRDGPAAGLAALGPTAADPADHPLAAAVRADLLRRAGDFGSAAAAYEAAIAHTANDAERRYLHRRLGECLARTAERPPAGT
jgi:RNA polymerase sigma-70 factor (ECF subfamily)